MKNLNSRKRHRYEPYSFGVKSGEVKDKQREYVERWITPHRQDWVYGNLKDQENALAYDASQAIYGTQKSVLELMAMLLYLLLAVTR